MSQEPVGIITEQGDLGLGFDALSTQDQELLKEQETKETNGEE